VRNTVGADQIERSQRVERGRSAAAQSPNVFVSSQSWGPGASSFIQIRGVRTIVGNNQPLFVVDGVPINNAAKSTFRLQPHDGGYAGEGTVVENRAIDINPNDIESVEILKARGGRSDLWRARGTGRGAHHQPKSGHAGATHFSYRSSAVVRRREPLRRASNEIRSGSLPCEADTLPLRDSSGVMVHGECDDSGNSVCRRSWGPPLPASLAVYDHSRELYTTGHVVENAMTVSGGNDRTTFYLSGENLNNNGIFVGDHDQFSRTTVRFKGSHRPMEALKLSANLAYADTRGHFIQRGNNVNAVQIPGTADAPEFNNLPYLDPVYHQPPLLPIPASDRDDAE